VKVAVDVQYHEGHAIAAAVAFQGWSDAVASYATTVEVPSPAAYEPGAFWKRELPAVLAVLNDLPFAPELVIVDAYVDLGPGRPGMGRRLHEALGLPVIGVAKTHFQGAEAIEVSRGGSSRPLYVTSAGLDPSEAAACVRGMHGNNRLPTLLQAADQLARRG
jgi:deoxyribonuclease V